MSAIHAYADLKIDGLPCQLVGYPRWHARRHELEQFIARRFRAEYGANPTHFMPLLVALQNHAGDVLALAGVRSALMEPLFLEHYLDAPVEQVLEPAAGRPLPRHQIVEMGNLAAVRPGHARYLFAAMTDLLLAWQFQWLCCTGVAGVRNLLRRLNMEPAVIALADARRVPDAARQWGRYYDKNPQVLAGEISQGRDCVARSGILERSDYVRLEPCNVLSA